MGAPGHTPPTRSLHCRLEGIPLHRVTPPDSHLGELFWNLLEKLETNDPIINKQQVSGGKSQGQMLSYLYLSPHFKQRFPPVCHYEKQRKRGQEDPASDQKENVRSWFRETNTNSIAKPLARQTPSRCYARHPHTENLLQHGLLPLPPFLPKAPGNSGNAQLILFRNKGCTGAS